MSEEQQDNLEDTIDMVHLRADCLHGAIQVLSCRDYPIDDPREPISLAEDFLAWILGTNVSSIGDDREAMAKNVADQISRARRGPGPADPVN